MESGGCGFWMKRVYLTALKFRYSILLALSLNVILFVDILEGLYNSASFMAFIKNLLTQINPYPQPNSIIIMDNCHIHKCQDVLDLITAWYVIDLSFEPVTSCNTYMTFLTNLGQSRILSHLSHHHRTSRSISELIQSWTTSIYLNPSRSSCFMFLS